jgi:hypothetical protein
MLSAMQDLPWIVDPKLPFRKRVAILRASRRWHEERLGRAEARVIALEETIGLIDNALRDYKRLVEQFLACLLIHIPPGIQRESVRAFVDIG